jgi:hypothetical protein
MLYNTANLIQVDQEIYHDPKMYTVSSLETRADPTENLPEGWAVVDQAVFNYELIVTKAYKTFNADVVVINEKAEPQYLVGEFEEWEETAGQ